MKDISVGGCCQATHEEVCNQALEHYEEISSRACNWSSVVPKAIKYYRDNYKEDGELIKHKARCDMSKLDKVARKVVGGEHYVEYEINVNLLRDILEEYFGCRVFIEAVTACGGTQRVGAGGMCTIGISTSESKEKKPIKEAMESVVPENIDTSIGKQSIRGDAYAHAIGIRDGYNQAISDMKANIEKYFKKEG